MKKLTNRITSQKLIKWRELEWFQSDSLKDLSEENLIKLKNSLMQNNFVQPFNVWIDKKKKVWILDGVHRAKAMKQLETEGVTIPEMLPANFVKCANKKEAAKLVLIYSSLYAKLNEIGLQEFLDINELFYSEIKDEICLSELDLDYDVDQQKAKEHFELKEIELKPYSKSHVLLSFHPDKLIKLQPFLDKILLVEGIEYEQSSN